MKLLIDNSVMHAFANVKDSHHNICKKFFEEHQNEKLYFSVHSFFEFKASRARRIKGKVFEGMSGNFQIKDGVILSITRELLDLCQEKKFFEKFQNLKGGDLLYACMAKAGDFTLVTCDTDFNEYKNEVDIIYLS